MMKAVPEALRKPWAFNCCEVVATTKSGSVVDALEEVAWMEKRPQGEVVPTPIWPCDVMRKGVLEARPFVLPS